MKKTKRILALAGALLLFAMYAATIVFALIGSENSLMLLRASIACTVIIPVFIYGYMLVYRVLKRNDCDIPEESDSDSQSSDS